MVGDLNPYSDLPLDAWRAVYLSACGDLTQAWCRIWFVDLLVLGDPS